MKAKKIITLIITGLAVLITAYGGVMKLIGPKEVIDALVRVSVDEYRILLGLMEITFATLFVFPKTLKAGFILLSCYFAGALATELSHGVPMNALLPIVMIWISAFLRDSSIFLSSDFKEKQMA
jgi:hypothetical protein